MKIVARTSGLSWLALSLVFGAIFYGVYQLLFGDWGETSANVVALYSFGLSGIIVDLKTFLTKF